jgi:hypothetical protein
VLPTRTVETIDGEVLARPRSESATVTAPSVEPGLVVAGKRLAALPPA